MPAGRSQLSVFQEFVRMKLARREARSPFPSGSPARLSSGNAACPAAGLASAPLNSILSIMAAPRVGSVAGQVPELQRLVLASRERRSAVRGDGDATHRSGVPGKVRNSLAVDRSLSVSDSDRSPRSRFGRRGNGNAKHNIRVPSEGAQLFSAFQVPEFQLVVVAPRKRGSAVRSNATLRPR